MITRRGLLGGLVGLIAAPAIVRVASLMPVSAPSLPPASLHLPGLTEESLKELMRSMSAPRVLMPTRLIVPARLVDVAAKILGGECTFTPLTEDPFYAVA